MRFTRSAQVPEAAGKDARHRMGRYDPPENPMTLQEAAEFIGMQIEATLRRKAATLGHPSPMPAASSGRDS